VIHRGHQHLLSIDFGLDRLTILEVSPGGIKGWYVRDLPAKVVRTGDPVEPSQLAQFLKQAIRESGMTGVRARFTLPDEAAIFRLVELPAMPRRHLHEALRYMVDKDVPLPLDRISWDWDILERTEIGYRICLVAAWRDVIERITRVAVEAGLQLELVEPRSLATARALDYDRVVLFDGSSERLQTLYLRRGEIPFVDQAPVGRDPVACARTLERLLRRGRSADSEETDREPVALGGDLEDLDLPLSMPAVRVSQILDPRLRDRAPGLPSGSLLANLGMADEVLRGYRTSRAGIADVNLLGTGKSRQQHWLRRFTGVRVNTLRRAASAGRQVPGAATAGVVGRGR
jgi:hypothetical protein